MPLTGLASAAYCSYYFSFIFARGCRGCLACSQLQPSFGCSGFPCPTYTYTHSHNNHWRRTGRRSFILYTQGRGISDTPVGSSSRPMKRHFMLHCHISTNHASTPLEEDERTAASALRRRGLAVRRTPSPAAAPRGPPQSSFAPRSGRCAPCRATRAARAARRPAAPRPQPAAHRRQRRGVQGRGGARR